MKFITTHWSYLNFLKKNEKNEKHYKGPFKCGIHVTFHCSQEMGTIYSFQACQVIEVNRRKVRVVF